MFIALNGSLLAGAKMEWPDMVRLAARFGYPGVDVYSGPAMALGVDGTRSLLEHLRIKPAGLSFPVEFRKDEETFQAGMAKLEEVAQFAAAIGCPRMSTWVMASTDTPKPEMRALLLKRFRAAADVLARSHVRLGLEFVSPVHLRKQSPHEFIWRMDEMLELAKDCGPNVGLLLDAWHWHHAGAKPADIAAAGRERIVHVHVSDAPNLPPDQIRDNERLMPGDGVIDLAGFFGALEKIGYRDAVSVEVFGGFMKEMGPEKAARAGLEKTRAVMRRAGVNWNA